MISRRPSRQSSRTGVRLYNPSVWMPRKSPPASPIRRETSSGCISYRQSERSSPVIGRLRRETEHSQVFDKFPDYCPLSRMYLAEMSTYLTKVVVLKERVFFFHIDLGLQDGYVGNVDTGSFEARVVNSAGILVCKLSYDHNIHLTWNWVMKRSHNFSVSSHYAKKKHSGKSVCTTHAL